MNKIAAAFTKAWQELKHVASAAASAVAKNQNAIQTVVADASTAVVALDPAAAPEVTAFDNLEEAIVGKVLALANDASTASSAQSLFTEEWPAIQKLVAVAKNHPTVASVTAALAPAKS